MKALPKVEQLEMEPKHRLIKMPHTEALRARESPVRNASCFCRWDGYYFTVVGSQWHEPPSGVEVTGKECWTDLELGLYSSAIHLTFLNLCSLVYKVGVLCDTCLLEQVEELECFMGYQDGCSGTTVWERRPLRVESFHSHHAAAHSFVENPQKLRFWDGQAYARATGTRGVTLNLQVEHANGRVVQW